MPTIDVTIPGSTFTVTKPNSSFTVTTPTEQTIQVGNPANNIDITNTPQNITVNTGGVITVTTTIDNTDELPEGTLNLYFTNARADARVQAGIAAIDYPVDSVNGKTNTVVLTTTDIGEGTNLYYTDARFDSRLATKTTDNLNEGTTNQYFTNARARQAIQVVDNGGDGSLSYDNSLGTITYTGPSASEVRAHFTGGTGIAITNGDIALDFTEFSTSDITEGTNLYYTEQRVEDHEFSELKVDNLVRINTVNIAVGTTAEFTLDSFDASVYATAHYRIQIKNSTNYQFVDLAVVQNGTTSTFVVYADIRTAGNLATFNVDIAAGQLRVLATPLNASTSFKAVRTATIA